MIMETISYDDNDYNNYTCNYETRYKLSIHIFVQKNISYLFRYCYTWKENEPFIL